MVFFTLTPKNHFSYLVYNCATVLFREWFQALVQCTLSASYGEFKMSGFLIGIYLHRALMWHSETVQKFQNLSSQHPIAGTSVSYVQSGIKVQSSDGQNYAA